MKMRKMLLSAVLALSVAMLFPVTSMARWLQDGPYWWWQNEDGSYPANRVMEIRGKRYAFDVNGYMISDSWVKLASGHWIYCTGDGSLARNQWIGNYYIGNDYVMLTDTWTPDGYYVGSDGEWVSGSGQQGASISSIPNGYYSSAGVGSDTDRHRVDLWVSYSGSTKQINFGLYEPNGTGYSFYDKQNPNGDTLDLYVKNGKIYGESTKSGHESYLVEFDGEYLTIYWEHVIWNSNSNKIRVRFRDGEFGDAVG